MPKQVDHDERRRQIIEALFRVAGRDGLAKATYRTIAAEAGMRAPQVQYYFPTRRELLDGALFELGNRVVGRGLALIEAAGPDATAEAGLRAAIAGSQPTDDEMRQNLVLFFLFYVEGLSDPAVGQSGLILAQRFIVQSFADAIRGAQERGETRPGIDPEREARLVLFANTGLVLASLLGIQDLDDAADAMDYLLKKIFL